ncbi:MAG TPA: hypothetical protein DDZ51_14060 [Planctomycetaceae bacterium]|nr:hypothetical protein [Planctomycetaceae bacterium]
MSVAVSIPGAVLVTSCFKIAFRFALVVIAFLQGLGIETNEHVSAEQDQPTVRFLTGDESPLGTDATVLPDDATALTDETRIDSEFESIRERLAKLEQQALGNVTKEGASQAGTADTKQVQTTGIKQDSPSKPDPKATNSDAKWSTKLGGHVQLDYITWADADAAIPDTENYFSYRRLRLVADGTGYDQFDFRLQLTLEPGQGPASSIHASAEVKDAYLSMNEVPLLGRIRFGNFFVPFSLEQVTNDTNNIFNERSIPSENIFAASREVGFAVYNATEAKNFTWSGGMFFDNINDTVKTRLDDNQGFRLSGRLTWLPYYYEPSNGRHLVHTGIGILHTDDHDNLVRFQARPQIQRGPVLIDSGPLAADAYTTGNLEFACVWGQVAVQAEAFRSSVNLNDSGSGDASGAYAHISYFLTGENRIFERFGQHGAQFGRNRPNTNFAIGQGRTGPGAWEVKARWSNLRLSDLDGGEYNDLTVGFNWYWSDRTRWMFDWIQPVTSEETTFGATYSDLLAMRFDFNW